MEMLRASFARLVQDESGAEAAEYALVAGMLIVATISVAIMAGKKMFLIWEAVSTKF